MTGEVLERVLGADIHGAWPGGGPRLEHGHPEPVHRDLRRGGGKLVGQFFYAILITLVVIFATISVGRAAERAKKAEEERSRGLFGRSRE